eukprot:SAG22_NODE_285_length_12974_cov_2.969087_6_plen_184_part_00
MDDAFGGRASSSCRPSCVNDDDLADADTVMDTMSDLELTDSDSDTDDANGDDPPVSILGVWNEAFAKVVAAQAEEALQLQTMPLAESHQFRSGALGPSDAAGPEPAAGGSGLEPQNDSSSGEEYACPAVLAPPAPLAGGAVAIDQPPIWSVATPRPRRHWHAHGTNANACVLLAPPQPPPPPA